MDVTVKPASGQDTPFSRNRLCARTNDDVHTGLGIGVACFADLMDATVLQADIGLIDP